MLLSGCSLFTGTWTEEQKSEFINSAHEVGWHSLNETCVLEWVPKRYSFKRAMRKLEEENGKLKMWFDGCF